MDEFNRIYLNSVLYDFIQFIVSLLLCLLDWCMALPMKMLLEPVSAGALEDPHASKAPLLDYIYRVSLRNEWDSLTDPLGHRSIFNKVLNSHSEQKLSK